MRSLLAVVAVLTLLAGCASPTGKDGGGTTASVQRTKVSTSSGGAMDVTNVPEPSAEEDPNAPCKHAFEHVRQGTHAWMDERGDVPMVSLCSPIECRKCGEVRHECTIGRIPGSRRP